MSLKKDAPPDTQVRRPCGAGGEFTIISEIMPETGKRRKRLSVFSVFIYESE
jgi:hypothetical protein